jgi:hypothetical protein
MTVDALRCKNEGGESPMIVHGYVKDNRILLDPLIQLPDGVQVEIIVPDTVETKVSSEARARADGAETESDFMKYAGIWEGLTDEDLGLDDLAERRQHFFGARGVEP